MEGQGLPWATLGSCMHAEFPDDSLARINRICDLLDQGYDATSPALRAEIDAQRSHGQAPQPVSASTSATSVSMFFRLAALAARRSSFFLPIYIALDFCAASPGFDFAAAGFA